MEDKPAEAAAKKPMKDDKAPSDDEEDWLRRWQWFVRPNQGEVQAVAKRIGRRGRAEKNTTLRKDQFKAAKSNRQSREVTAVFKHGKNQENKNWHYDSVIKIKNVVILVSNFKPDYKR